MASAGQILPRLQNTSFTALAMSSLNFKHPFCIDVHHHYFPPDLNKAKTNELAQWRAPPGTLPWSIESSISAMDAANIDVAILSVPAIPTISAAAARQYNIAMRHMCLKHPNRFGFFAVPCLHNVKGTSRIEDYVMVVLKD